ncbi:MAG: DegT/DnrJ/EryC1/StrS family aminotransferase, partial [Planctomycetota bacterium]
EDVSHAQGGLYKGRMLGTLGDVGCMSLMSGKSFPIGEAGMLVTKDQHIWERATAFGFYERTGTARFGTVDVRMTDPGLKRFAGIPLGGCKHRMNQTCSAMGRVQLAHYPERIAEIQKAMDLFWGYLDGVPGIRPHRADASQGSTMGGRYCPVGHYLPEELGGLSLETFVRALAAEGVPCGGAPNAPLHLHPFFHEADVYNHGKPTVIANVARDVRQGPGSLPVTEAAPGRVLQVPWFKHAREEYIREYADAVRKVIGDADALR